MGGRGLHSLASLLNLRTFGNTSFTLELNLRTLETHPRVNLGYMEDKVSYIERKWAKLAQIERKCKRV